MAGPPAPPDASPPPPMALFDKFKSGLQKTRQVLNTDVRDLFKAGAILDEAMLEEFEGRLIRTDMGVEAADEIVAELRKTHLGRTVDPRAIAETVNAKLRDLLVGDGAGSIEEENADPLARLNVNPGGPTVVLGLRRERGWAKRPRSPNSPNC